MKTIKKAAEALAKGKIVGWYQGHGEIGPRALGNRSILMCPKVKDGQRIINEKVKKREPYRPFGASVLYNHVGEHFNWHGESKYMLFVTDMLQPNDFKAIAHVDNTCRIQTVSDKEPQFIFYHKLIDEFRKLTGIPMLLNTSLNVDGKPIAGYMEDAKTVFNNSEMDVVVIGDEISYK